MDRPSREIKNSGGSEINYCSGKIGITVERLK